MWWSCSHACCAGEVHLLHCPAVLQHTGLECSPCFTYIAGITVMTIDLVHNAGLVIIRKCPEGLHVDLNINVWQNPSHRFWDTLNVWNGDMGSRIILYLSVLPRWWALRREEALWVAILLEGLLHLSSRTRLFIEQWEATLFSRVETTACLWAVVWWEKNWRYWSVWVGLRYTLVELCNIVTSKSDITCPCSLSSELDVLVDRVDVGPSIPSTWSAVRTSSTYLFQNTVGTGDVLRARSSMCSITTLSTATDTSDPIAVPKICWCTVPL